MKEEVSMLILKALFEKELIPFIRISLYQLVKATLDTPVSLNRAAEMMGIKRATLKKRCQRGDFPYTKVGGVYYISVIDVNLYLNCGPDEMKKYNPKHTNKHGNS